MEKVSHRQTPLFRFDFVLTPKELGREIPVGGELIVDKVGLGSEPNGQSKSGIITL